MAKYRTGFLSFDTDDEDTVWTDSLTVSATADVSWADDQGGGQLFSSNGMDPNGADGIRYRASVNVPNYANLFDQGHLTFEVDTSFIKYDFLPAANKYPISRPQLNFTKYTAGYIDIAFIATTGTPRIKISSVGKGSHTRVDIIWRRGKMDVYFDYLRVCHGNIGTHASGITNFADWYIGGLTTLADYFQSGKNIRNFRMSYRPQAFPISTEYGSIGFIGDSFTTGGSFPTYAVIPSGATWPEHAGYGYNSSDVAITTVGDSYYDVNIQPTIIRELSKRGIWTRNNKNYGRSGAEVNDGAIPAKQTAMFLDGQYRTKVIMYALGANDAVHQGGIGDITANFETQYKAMITEANAHKVNHVSIPTILSLRASSLYQSTAFDNAVDDLNAIIDQLKDWSIAQGHSTQVHIDDEFNHFGGHSINPDDFLENDIHLSEIGRHKYGVSRAGGLFV